MMAPTIPPPSSSSPPSLATSSLVPTPPAIPRLKLVNPRLAALAGGGDLSLEGHSFTPKSRRSGSTPVFPAFVLPRPENDGDWASDSKPPEASAPPGPHRSMRLSNVGPNPSSFASPSASTADPGSTSGSFALSGTKLLTRDHAKIKSKCKPYRREYSAFLSSRRENSACPHSFAGMPSHGNPTILAS